MLIVNNESKVGYNKLSVACAALKQLMILQQDSNKRRLASTSHTNYLSS